MIEISVKYGIPEEKKANLVLQRSSVFQACNYLFWEFLALKA